jgi:formate hydrogenlyase subunit 6/NADH:ubiquinone oxidoreductase subunit I
MYDDACPFGAIQTANVTHILFSSKKQCVVTNNDFSKSQINWYAINLAYPKHGRVSST